MRKLLFSAVTAVVAVVALAPSVATAETLSGDIPSSGGIGVATWGGGPIEGVVNVAAQSGCGVQSIWTTSGGEFLGYRVGAPAFVNSEFTAAYGASLPAGTIVMLVCGAGTPTPAPPPTSSSTPISELLLDLGDWEPGAVVADEGCLNIATLPLAMRMFDGISGYLAVDGERMQIATSAVLKFANEAAAQAHVNDVRAGGPDGIARDAALNLGIDPDEFLELYLEGASSHALSQLGDGGIQMLLDFNDGTYTDYAIVSIGELVLEVSLGVVGEPTPEAGPFATSTQLLELMHARAEAALATGIDTSECL